MDESEQPHRCKKAIGRIAVRAKKAETRVGELERELAEAKRKAAEDEARVKELEETLAQERACHDCSEYRAMMERKAADLVERLRARWPHHNLSAISFPPETSYHDPGPPTCIRCALDEVIGEGR